MSTLLLPAAASPAGPASVITQKFRLTLTLVPDVLAALQPVYINLLLGSNHSPEATALLSNFAGEGGAVTKHWMNAGSTGDFAGSIRMQCRAGTPAAQAIGVVSPEMRRFQFDVALASNCRTSDAFNLWLLDQGANWLPSTAVARPGLFASVTWTKDGQFSGVGFRGNGTLGGQSILGFAATVEAL